MLLAGLSTGHMIGLGLVGGAFVAFALFSSFVAPRIWPDFPGELGLPVFLIASVAMFAAMLTAVAVFGVEEPEGEANAAEATGGEVSKTVAVQEKEFKIVLPSLGTMPPGRYEFDVENVGQAPHDLVVEGGTLNAEAKTPTLDPGKSAKLAVTLGQGVYTLYCSIDGHRKLGMVAKLTVG